MLRQNKISRTVSSPRLAAMEIMNREGIGVAHVLLKDLCALAPRTDVAEIVIRVAANMNVRWFDVDQTERHVPIAVA